jgi:hypothetical protein
MCPSSNAIEDAAPVRRSPGSARQMMAAAPDVLAGVKGSRRPNAAGPGHGRQRGRRQADEPRPVHAGGGSPGAQHVGVPGQLLRCLWSDVDPGSVACPCGGREQDADLRVAKLTNQAPLTGYVTRPSWDTCLGWRQAERRCMEMRPHKGPHLHGSKRLFVVIHACFCSIIVTLTYLLPGDPAPISNVLGRIIEVMNE